jgi:hypothetical protein
MGELSLLADASKYIQTVFILGDSKQELELNVAPGFP